MKGRENMNWYNHDRTDSMIEDGKNSLGLKKGDSVFFVKSDWEKLKEGKLVRVESSFAGEVFYVSRKGICHPIYKRNIVLY